VSPAEVLLTDLRACGVTVSLDDGGELRCRSRRGVLTSELRQRIAEHKVDLIFLLQDEAYEITKRVAAMHALAGDDGRVPRVIVPVPSEGAFCETCGEAQAYGRVPRCVLCALAAARLVEDRRGSKDRLQEYVA
jgi:hypothetical protein